MPFRKKCFKYLFLGRLLKLLLNLGIILSSQKLFYNWCHPLHDYQTQSYTSLSPPHNIATGTKNSLLIAILPTRKAVLVEDTFFASIVPQTKSVLSGRDSVNAR